MVEKRLGEIMSSKFVSVAAECPLTEAIELLCRKNLVPRVLVVVDEKKSFRGLLTMECILESVRPTYMRSAGEKNVVTWNGLLLESCERVSALTAGQVADEDAPCLAAEDRLVRAIDVCLKTNRRELAVLDDGCLVGLIDMENVIWEIKNLVAMSQKQEGMRL